jgi:hypothetical protein
VDQVHAAARWQRAPGNVAALMPLGRPVKQLTRLRRRPVEEILVADRWDGVEP